MEWTPVQQQVLEHGDGWLQVRGPAGSGKTTTLVERWRRRTHLSGHPERVLVLCRSRDGADRFRRAALAEQAWAAEDLPFTTLYGAAFDLLRRHRGERRLLTRAEQWTVVRRMLGDDEVANWRSCPEFVGRAAFVDEVAGAILEVEGVGASDDSVLAVAEACGQGERWRDLLDFRRRYRSVTRALGVVDGAQLFTEASEILIDPELAAAEAGRWDEVILDDSEAITASMGRLIEDLAPALLVAVGVDRGEMEGIRRADMTGAVSAPASVVAATDSSREWPGACWFDRFLWPATVDFAKRHRLPVAPSLLRCRHPSTEADAIAGALQGARDAGVRWSDMAVLVRSERQRAQVVGRGLARHGIPVRMIPGSNAAEPAVRTIIDFFAWAGGDESALERLLVSPALDLAPTELRQIQRAAALGDADLTDHPRVARMVALRDSVAPRLRSADPAALVNEAWVELLGGLVPDPDREGSLATTLMESRALDAVASFLAGVGERAAHDLAWRIADELALVDAPDFDPDPWVPLARLADDDMVTVSSIWAAGGRSWDTVVVAGCLEGELPRVSATAGFFDAALAQQARLEEAGLGQRAPRPESTAPGLSVPRLSMSGSERSMSGPERSVSGPERGLPTIAERRHASLEDQRRLFRRAASRARRKLVATAAPAPGQLVSRFVATAPDEPVRLPRPGVVASTLAPRSVVETVGVAPVHLDRRLSLSATRLKTYDDCPLRYFYQYTLGVRGPGGVAASMGTVVHEALAGFLDPHGSSERTWPALESLAESLWADLSDTIAPYQPMREQARRDIFAMLQDWWLVESAQAEAAGEWPDVVAVEYPFDIELAGHRVRGSIDRIDRVPGGIAIVDYKTGSQVLRAEDVADDLQLATYHLAALRDPDLALLGPPVSLRLCYLRSGAQPSQTITDDHAARTERRIVEAAERILSEDFEPSVEADCDYCDFWRLCPLQIQGRQVGWE